MKLKNTDGRSQEAVKTSFGILPPNLFFLLHYSRVFINCDKEGILFYFLNGSSKKSAFRYFDSLVFLLMLALSTGPTAFNNFNSSPSTVGWIQSKTHESGFLTSKTFSSSRQQKMLLYFRSFIVDIHQYFLLQKRGSLDRSLYGNDTSLLVSWYKEQIVWSRRTIDCNSVSV